MVGNSTNRVKLYYVRTNIQKLFIHIDKKVKLNYVRTNIQK